MYHVLLFCLICFAVLVVLLTTYHLAQVKLSLAGDVEKLKACWAGPGLLATVSLENLVRLWNLEQDENYTLQLAGRRASRSG